MKSPALAVTDLERSSGQKLGMKHSVLWEVPAKDFCIVGYFQEKILLAQFLAFSFIDFPGGSDG